MLDTKEETLKTWYCLECGEITDEGMQFCSSCEDQYSEED